MVQGLLSRLVLALVAAGLCTAAPSLAEEQKPGASPSATAPAQADPVVAKVNGQVIHLSDVSEAAKTLPPQMQAMPPNVLYPMLIEQLVDRQALTAEARKLGLDKDPAVQKQMAAASDRALQAALITKEVGPQVTEEAVRARYDKELAGKPGEEEVHARHILVPTEAEAKDIIAQLKKGADFSTLAKQHSKDPGAASGGDLGFFKKGDMVPEFANAAFALQPGQYTQTPVHTQFGWHVIKLEGRKRGEPVTFDQAKDELRQTMIQENVQKVLQQARNDAKIEKFNLDGSPATTQPPAAPTPTPPPAPAR